MVAAAGRIGLLGSLLLAWSLLYTSCARALTGHGETLTLTCRPMTS